MGKRVIRTILTKNKINFIGFILLITVIFVHLVYLFRPASANRERFVGLINENLDVVYIGGSAAYVYWQPLNAWNQFGFTSYTMAGDTLQAENVEYYIKEAEKTQDPDLYIIDLRPFEIYSDETAPNFEAGLRHGTDSMNITSWNRYLLAYQYLKDRNMQEDTDWLSFFLDIILYHNNYTNLSDPLAWDLIDNNVVAKYKGWRWIDQYSDLSDYEYASYVTKERHNLTGKQEELLRHVLDYCSDKNLNVLFVVCPFCITDYPIFNSMNDLINEYGFEYINCNDYIEEIGIDFSRDFYNSNHVNTFGAEKYTTWLGNFIVSRYDLPDHRSDPEYSNWDSDYSDFTKEDEGHREIIENYINLVNVGEGLVSNMKEAQSFNEWYMYASDERYVMLTAKRRDVNKPMGEYIRYSFRNMGITFDNSDEIAVATRDGEVYSNLSSGVDIYSGTVSGYPVNQLSILYDLALEDDNLNVSIGGEKLMIGESDITIFIIDKYLSSLVCITEMNVNETGQIFINSREP